MKKRTLMIGAVPSVSPGPTTLDPTFSRMHYLSIHPSFLPNVHITQTPDFPKARWKCAARITLMTSQGGFSEASEQQTVRRRWSRSACDGTEY